MKRFTAWLVENADGVIALVLSSAMGIIAYLHIVGTEEVNAAILLILALVAATVLRDRSHTEATDRQLHEVLADASSALARIPDPGRLEQIERTIARISQTLDDASMVRVLHGKEVTEAFARARRNTDRWVFKGGTGTYVRAVTLPECVDIARREKRTLHVQLEIIDPANEQVCQRYADYRRSLSPGPDSTGELWTLDRTRKESFATILASCWYRQRFTFLTIAVGLSQIMSTFRWDMSSGSLVITQEDPGRPAMVIEADKSYYRSYSQELLASLDQTRQVPIGLARDVPLGDEPTVDETRKLFTRLSLPLPRSFADRDVSDIIRKAIQPKNPYA
jgi:hypothetical protein